ncbi:MAG: glycoside hydrolase family 127 protein, partial [Porticoccaceae bacterium]|nr:glycoside hydrolase family 127 protein [Porticoccaceae bacterium]
MKYRYTLAFVGALSLLTLGCSESPTETTVGAEATSVVQVVDRPDTSVTNQHYVSNRAPLAPSALIKLPVGAIKPQGWLLAYLERQRDGLTGNLGEISAWLQKEDNAWLSKDGKGAWGWEEVPYWLKGYANIGYILEDQAMIEEAKIWLDGAINSQRENGDFGPDQRFKDDGTRDYWANMIMVFALQSWYEHSKDERVIELMARYFRHLAEVQDTEFLTQYWQKLRAGDLLHSVFWLYNRTGESWLLDFAHKVHRNTADWTQEDHLPDWHNVNIAQAFRQPATYYLLSGEQSHLDASYSNHHFIRKLFGQVPGGMWGGDEVSRLGKYRSPYDDPHQAIETCAIVEQLFSNEMMLWITGDPFWADHAEDVAFNTAPAAALPDYKGLRYLTAPNQVTADDTNHAPGIHNEGPFFLMSALSSRCCQHNHTQGWPYYSENLWMATPDNGAAAILYAANDTQVTLGDGVNATLKVRGNYP